MTELDALKEYLSEKQFSKEPLAMCIMLYLQQEHPGAYHDILKLFDEHMNSELNRYIQETIDDEAAADCN